MSAKDFVVFYRCMAGRNSTVAPAAVAEESENIPALGLPSISAAQQRKRRNHEERRKREIAKAIAAFAALEYEKPWKFKI